MRGIRWLAQLLSNRASELRQASLQAFASNDPRREIPEQSINCIRRRLRWPSVRIPSAPPGVRTSSHDFLRHRIARHPSGLQRQQSVCLVFSTLSAAHWRRAQSKVSGPKFPFPRLLFARCPPRRISNGARQFERQHLTPVEWMISAQTRLCRRSASLWRNLFLRRRR
jgi:hypothetical protein